MHKVKETAWGEPKEVDRQFNRIEYFFKKQKNENAFQCISDQTINDIDFKDIFAFVDRTHSRIGQQYLYNKLLTIEKDFDFSEQEELCEYLTKESKVRSLVQAQLSKLNDENAYNIARLFLDEYIRPPRHFAIIIILSILRYSLIRWDILY